MDKLTLGQLRLLKPHPYAECFPMIDDDMEAYESFRDDIREKGILSPIVLYDNQLLDGRNRRLVALDLEIECPYYVYDGTDPLGFVISANTERRHMTINQRAETAAKLANIVGKGRPTKNACAQAISQSEAAERLGVSRDSVQKAKIVIDKGTDQLQKAFHDGKVKITEAAKIAQLPEQEQDKAVAKALGPKPKSNEELARERENANGPVNWSDSDIKERETAALNDLTKILPNHCNLRSNLMFLIDHKDRTNVDALLHYIDDAMHRLGEIRSLLTSSKVY